MLEWVAIASCSFFPSSVLFATLREAGYLEGVALFQRLLKIFFFFLLAEFTVLCLLDLFIVGRAMCSLAVRGLPSRCGDWGRPSSWGAWVSR